MQATMAQARRSAPAMEDWVQPLASSQPDALRGLFQACTVTRDLVLRTAGKVTVRVQLPSFKKPVSGTVLRGLSTRGRQPTQLCVEATEKASDSDVANGSVQLFAALQARGRVISALEFAPPLTRPDIAHQLAATFPALRQLTLTDLRTPLPPSELMPHLTDLDIVFADIHGDELPLWQSVAKYLPQLQRLGLYTGYDGCDGSEYCFDVLFGPDTPPTLSLTHLETQHMCRGDLVGQLLTHVPNLTHLIVGAMQVDTVEHRGQQWGVRELYCKGVQDEDDMGRVANLPRPRDGPVKLGSPYGLSMVVEREQGLSDSVIERLSDWVLAPHPHYTTHPTLNLRPGDGLDPFDQPAALSAALRQVSGLQLGPEGTLWLRGWQWTAEMSVGVREALSHVGQLNVGVGLTDQTTSSVYEHIITLGPKLRHVEVEGRLTIPTSTHALVPWPWENLSAKWLCAETLLKLPMPVPLGQRRVVRGKLELDLTIEQVASGAAALLADKMRGVHLTSIEDRRHDAEVVLVCQTNLPHQLQPMVLRAQIAVLQGMTTDAETFNCVIISGYTLTKALVAELASLPLWEATLFLRGCTIGTDGTHALTSMAEHVPVSYPRWAMRSGEVAAEHIMAVCMGVMKHRAAGLPPLCVHCLPHRSEWQHLGDKVIVKPEHWL